MNKKPPILIIVSGPPASGKTTLARRLSQDLALFMLSKDDLKEIMWDEIGYDHEQRGKVAKASYTIMYEYAKRLLALGRGCLLESNFVPEFSVSDFRKVQEVVSCRIIEIHCIAPFEVLVRRAKDRFATGTRHPGHCDEDIGNSYENFYFKSEKTLGIAEREVILDPAGENFSYKGLLLELSQYMDQSKKAKIVVFTPLEAAEKVRTAMAEAGAGVIGNYTHCSFSSVGKGRFLPMDGATPAIGEVGILEEVEEERIEVVCAYDVLEQVISTMKKVHPYEEVAYDVYEILDM